MIKFKLNIINVPLTDNLYQRIGLLIKWLYMRLLKKNKYVTERYRPIFVNKLNESLLDKTFDVAILMRGQIIKNDEFTLNTLKIYRANFPKAPIYLSTWDYCVDDDLCLFSKKNNIKLIISEFNKPTSGYGADNLQIIGNVNGLNAICEDKVKYCISTRTDQRFYSSNILIYLKNLISHYQYKKSNPNDKQLNRLIAMSFDTFLYRLYGLGDMFLFGLTEDVLNYWNSEKDTRVFTKEDLSKVITLRDLSNLRVDEVYFMTEFLKRNGHKLEWSIEDYLDVLRKRFIIIDSNSLDFLWPKYSFFEERYKDFRDIRFKEVSYLDWLLIKNYKLKFDDKILDSKRHS